MKISRSSFRVLVLLVGLVAVGPTLRAQDLNLVRQRMEQRLPDLDAAKVAGEIGETNKGLLDARKDTPKIGELVASENSDRLTVYAAIARKTGASAEAVAQARAKQIAAQSAPGIWLQHPDGSWYRK
tara:strand:+ start:353 stop:733 length:381 start_codon:yes stop_codon:yes gene_type:complete